MKYRSKASVKKGIFGVASVACCGLFAITGVSATGANAAGNADANGKWYTDFATYEAEQAYAMELNETIMEEGAVLLKNQNNALPFKDGVKNITVFGMGSYNLITGGTGSGGGGGNAKTLLDSLTAAGFNINDKVADVYQNTTCTAAVSAGMMGGTSVTVEAPVSVLDQVKGSYAHFGDAAIMTITRVGGEGADLYTHDIVTHSDKTDHVLSLDDNEKALLAEIKANFKNVVILVNSANVFELGSLQNDPGINGILWIGQPGTTGIMGVGQILNGNVSPSGKTVDIYPADLKKDPTWQNFGDGAQVGTTNKVQNASNMTEVEYEEGIYVGYKYYETASVEGYIDYNEQVVYPFGYGLSYTSFQKEIVTSDGDIAARINNATGLDTKITVSVKVTNTGSVAGKDVAELYVTAPYTRGGIEKSSVSLVSFAKTNELKPGESQIVNLEVRIADLCSFDYNDANHNGVSAYELEQGAYQLKLMNDSHTTVDTAYVNLNQKLFNAEGDPQNVFSRNDDYDTLMPMKEGNGMTIMSRADFAGTFPTAPTVESLTYSQRVIDTTLNPQYTGATYDPLTMDTEDDLWYKTEADIPAVWTQAASTDGRVDGKTAIQLSELSGVDVNTAAGQAKWDEFLNQMTYAEMAGIVLQSGYYQTNAVDSIGKEHAQDADGPAQLSNGTFWCCEVVIASTWNVDLAYEQGVLVGNESLFLDCPGWYGPAMNIHRSAFAGRNFEYYSQDALQGGFIAAAVVKGAQSKGTNCYIKHYGLNDQETNRQGVNTWADEQNMRENYLKNFEYAAKFGNATGVMTSFNRVGCIYGMANYRMDNTVLREEWGFQGACVTDYYNSSVRADYMQRAGCELPLGNYSGTNVISGTWDAAKNAVVYDGVASPTQYYAVRTSAQRVLWVAANTNVIENGLKQDAYAATQSLSVYTGVSTNSSIAAGSTLGSKDVKYAVTGGTLPAGLSLNKLTGVISGSATAAPGTYSVTVTMTADGWITKDSIITIKVEDAFNYNGVTTVKDGSNLDAYNISVSSGFINTDNGYTSVTYSATGLPAGCEMTADGKITGTVNGVGSYDVTVNVRAASTSGSGSSATTTYTNFARNYTLVVTEADPTIACIVFDSNGGSGVAAQGVKVGATATVPTAPTRPGYSFEGWYLDKACTAAADLTNTVTGDTTYYAKWSEIYVPAVVDYSPYIILGVTGIVLGVAGIAVAVAALVKKH